MTPAPRRSGLLRPHPIVAAVAFFKLALMLWTATAYGYSSQELYHLACARRLAWGYVDGPPLSVLTLALATRIYGETLLSLRLVPALAGTVTVILTARLAARFGARPVAQGLAALCVLFAPGILSTDHTFDAASLEMVLAVGLAGLLARAVTSDPDSRTRDWLRVGFVVGLGCMNRLTMIPFALALALGLSVTAQRRWWKERGPWLALLVAAVVFAPFVVWEQKNGFPTREYLANVARATRQTNVAGFLWEQLRMMLPTTALVWGAGLVALLRPPPASGGTALAPYRFFGVAFVALFVVYLLVGPSAAGFVLPFYPILVAAGVAALDAWLSSPGWRYGILAGLVAIPGIAAVPLALPLFRVAGYASYVRALHLPGTVDGRTGLPLLPDRFGDMYGWPEMVRTVATVVDALPIEDRREAVVLASNVGEAGALEMFGSLVELPGVISGHDSFWTWGTGFASGKVVVAVGGDEQLLRQHWSSVEVATVFGHSLATAGERRVRIDVCRGPVESLDAMWRGFRRYD